MSVLSVGDVVVLVSGSPRLAVEEMVGKSVKCVWINEGVVNRDTFDIALIRKWEPNAPSERGGDRGFKGGDRGGKGGGKGRGKPFEGKGFDKPKGDKSFFRKD